LVVQRPFPTQEYEELVELFDQLQEEYQHSDTQTRKYQAEEFLALYANYSQSIGTNGFLDAFVTSFGEDETLNGMVSHMLGSMIMNSTNVPRWAIQAILSVKGVHLSTLHGAVWQSIEQYGREDLSGLEKHIINDLCWFQHDSALGNAWISCIHGVGHGFYRLYDQDIEQAIELCASFQTGNFDFQYSCASGAYMDATKTI